MEDEPRIAAWNAKVDWPLTGLTLVFLAGYAWQVLDTSLDPRARGVLDLVLNRQLRDDFRGRVPIYVGATVGLVGFVAALAVLEAERSAPDASITTFGEAVWWTITTISTVGYGDRYPVTVEGRIVAATLMVAGIALLGVVTASIAAWFVENVRRAGEQVSE